MILIFVQIMDKVIQNYMVIMVNSFPWHALGATVNAQSMPRIAFDLVSRLGRTWLSCKQPMATPGLDLINALKPTCPRAVIFFSCLFSFNLLLGNPLIPLLIEWIAIFFLITCIERSDFQLELSSLKMGSQVAKIMLLVIWQTL